MCAGKKGPISRLLELMRLINSRATDYPLNLVVKERFLGCFMFSSTRFSVMRRTFGSFIGYKNNGGDIILIGMVYYVDFGSPSCNLILS